MNKPKVNAFVDVIAFSPFCDKLPLLAQFIWILMPRAGNDFRNRKVAFWVVVHAYLELISIVIVAVHLILHWSYIKGLPQPFKTEKLQEEA
ncbi:MAG TPA: hypothetical protein VEG44_05895 [Candidatus Acidoferrales bacterium]|nr:hypothetical protein [Candidatus Acidoferrales bacterium]